MSASTHWISRLCSAESVGGSAMTRRGGVGAGGDALAGGSLVGWTVTADAAGADGCARASFDGTGAAGAGGGWAGMAVATADAAASADADGRALADARMPIAGTYCASTAVSGESWRRIPSRVMSDLTSFSASWSRNASDVAVGPLPGPSLLAPTMEK